MGVVKRIGNRGNKKGIKRGIQFNFETRKSQITKTLDIWRESGEWGIEKTKGDGTED